MVFAASTFLEVTFALMILIPVTILWVVAVVDMIRRRDSGLKLAGLLLLVLVFPILGPVLYLTLRKPDSDPAAAEAALMAQADLQREAARRPVGGTGMYR